MIDYTALAAELLAGHPDTGVYSADSQIAADQLNEPNRTVDKTTTGAEAADATDATEFNALLDADRSIWVGVLAWDTINLNVGIGLATAQGIWAGVAGTITRPALIATRTHIVGRSVELDFGNVKDWQVEQARTL